MLQINKQIYNMESELKYYIIPQNPTNIDEGGT